MENEKSRATNRRKRVPLSGHRDILTVQGKDPNYVYRWVNDEAGRVDRLKDAGYDLVDHEVEVGVRKVDSSAGTSSVVSKNVGNGTTAYLMRIKREWHEEDKAAAQKQIDESEADMKRTLNSKQNGTYGKVNIE